MDVVLRVRGHHGTSATAATSILREGFRASRNAYDWLGDGVYFFQDAPARAQEWATTLHGPDAAVIESSIRLANCMDLLDISWAQFLADSYNSFLRALKQTGRRLVQTTGAHRLDRAVINYAVGVLGEQGIQIRAVRAAFSEGRPVFPGSALYDRAHVQIAVRDTSLIEDSKILTNPGGA